ncbi:MAG: hypothetical protein QOH82_549, partial [Mycobacterium sp.]|nr:hypothetical protein [Mycobacterium sp.]
MRLLSTLLRTSFAMALAVGLWMASPHIAKAEGVEYL